MYIWIVQTVKDINKFYLAGKETKFKVNNYNEEIDPGSGWTLATGLTQASRGAAFC